MAKITKLKLQPIATTSPITVWNFSNFPATLILRDISFG